jgi:hypothetical protein
MQQIAAAQRRYDRQLPMEPASPAGPQVARLLRVAEPDPFAALREDIARDYRAAQDISTAWYDALFDGDDNNTVVAHLLAGDDAGALAAVRRALCAVADARAAMVVD